MVYAILWRQQEVVDKRSLCVYSSRFVVFSYSHLLVVVDLYFKQSQKGYSASKT